jgi:[ribosomal protein S5]-alanine N-acetyltransferase
MIAPTLRTERLILRQIRADDASALHPALSDADLMTWGSSAPHTRLAETEAYMTQTAKDVDGSCCWAITKEKDEALGWIILIEKRAGVQELGYILRRDAWGKGFAREAAYAVISHAFEVLGQRRILADVDPENKASVKLLESLRFQYEGHLRAEWETHLGVRDSLIYGLLAGEWAASEAGGEKQHG